MHVMAESPALPLPLGGRRIGFVPGSDAKLVRRAAAGDERAFAAIYERFHQELYRYCRAILGDPDDAQDALQATMASALRALPGETRTIALRPWLYRVARNEALTIVRRRQSVAELDEAALPVHPAADVDAESRERLRLLVADLAALPERQRSALVMRELSGLSYDDIAAALEVSGGAARQVVYEARVALQELDEGRTMECDRVRRAISERDGRVLRGRKIRAHLRGCARCSDFKLGLEARTADLQLIAPPLTAAAASGVLATVAGGGASAGAIGSGLLGGGLAGGALTAKTVGVIAASAAIGAAPAPPGGSTCRSWAANPETRPALARLPRIPMTPATVPARRKAPARARARTWAARARLLMTPAASRPWATRRPATRPTHRGPGQCQS